MSSSPDDPVTSQPIPMGAGDEEEVNGVDERTNLKTAEQPSYGADDAVPPPTASGDEPSETIDRE